MGVERIIRFSERKKTYKSRYDSGNINFLGAISENNEIREKLKQLKRLVDDE